MADTKRDLTGVPVEDLSAEEAAVAANELTAKISELISQMRASEKRQAELNRQSGDIHGFSGFKGYLARMMNQKLQSGEQRKQDDLRLNIVDLKKLQAMMLRKSVMDFRSNPKNETESAANDRFADLKRREFSAIHDLFNEGVVDKDTYVNMFRELNAQAKRVKSGGVHNLDASKAKVEEDAEAAQNAKVNDYIFDRAKDFGAKIKDSFMNIGAGIGAEFGNSRIGRGISKFYSIASPFYQKNKESFKKVFSGQTGAKGAAGALSGAAEMIPDVNKFTKAAKLALQAMGTVVQWSGEYTEDRAETRQKGIAGGFGEGAMGTEKAQQYKDIGESLNKGGGQTFVRFAANVNHLLEQMRRGGGGGALETANQRYGLVLNGSGAGGLAKDADEVIRNIISRVSAYRKAGNHQAVAGLMQTLGVDQKNMELFMHGQSAYDQRVKTKTKMADAAMAQRLDESAMKTVESDFDAVREKRLRNESWSRFGNAVTRAWNGTTRLGNAALGSAGAALTGDRRERADGFFSNYLATDENAAERRAVAPIAMQEDLRKLTSSVPFIPSTVSGGAAGGGVSQENSLNVKVEKVELHTNASTLEGSGQDVGVGIKEGLESWSKPLVKNFGDAKL